MFVIVVLFGLVLLNLSFKLHSANKKAFELHASTIQEIKSALKNATPDTINNISESLELIKKISYNKTVFLFFMGRKKEAVKQYDPVLNLLNH